MVNYTNVQRAFLQSVGRFSVLRLPQAQEILGSVKSKYGDDGDNAADATALHKIIDEINAKFTEHEVEQQLAIVYQEFGNQEADISGEFLVLCSTFASVGLSPAYNEAECSYMKLLMERIITSDTHAIPVMQAIYISAASAHASQSQSSTKKITKQRAEELLEDWCTAGYFMISNGDSITLGPRSIGEFNETLRTKFGDFIQNCHLCNAIVLQPMHCSNDDCQVSLDRRCFTGYVAKKKKCPGCKIDWEGEGEGEEEEQAE